MLNCPRWYRWRAHGCPAGGTDVFDKRSRTIQQFFSLRLVFGIFVGQCVGQSYDGVVAVV